MEEKNMRHKPYLGLFLAIALALAACGGGAATTAAPQPTQAPVALTIESWRNDDLTIWQDTIIPAFEKHYPNIHVVFAPTAPADYNAALNTKLTGGTAGDVIKSAWITDDGQSVFCVPMASVIHGFFYNADAFEKLGLKEPATLDEFYAVLEAIKKDGTYSPLGMGTADQWEAATMGFQNIGPNYWKGEEGRPALIKGTGKFTDAPYVATFAELAKWKPYMPAGFEPVKYPDAQSLFTLGKAAIYPAGSWEISLFNSQAAFKMGVFPPP